MLCKYNHLKLISNSVVKAMVIQGMNAVKIQTLRQSKGQRSRIKLTMRKVGFNVLKGRCKTREDSITSMILRSSWLIWYSKVKIN